MGHHSTSSRGRRKSKVPNRQDRISKLPDELIIRILSMMEMEEAVKTGILSKRWKDLWTRVDNIVFAHPCEFQMFEDITGSIETENLKLERYFSFIDLTLMRCTGPKITSFYLHIQRVFGNQSVDELLYKWIAHVLEKKVESVTLICDWNKIIYVPDCLYQSSSLTDLVLEDVTIDVSSPVNWNKLKRLTLRNMTIDDDGHIDNILKGSPLLETISFYSVSGIENMNIMSTSVENLVLLNFEAEAEADNIMNIKAPWISELEINGTFLMTKCQLLDVSSLLKATLHFSSLIDYEINQDDDCEEVYEFNKEWIPMVTNLLRSVSHVQQLIIGPDPIQVLSFMKLSGQRSPIFQECKHVSITSPLRTFDFPGIVYLLENGPNMETLFIKVHPLEDGSRPLPQVAECLNEGVTTSMRNGGNIMAHLKSVNIHYSPQCTQFEYLDYEMAEYILKGAVVLEKLVLSSSSRRCRSRILNLSRKLSTLLNMNRGENWKLKKINIDMFEFIFPKTI